MRSQQRFGWAAIVTLASLPLPGCDSIEGDCVDLCERTQSCPRLDLNLGSCDAQCERLADVTDGADCDSEVEDYLACTVDAPDPCRLEASCSAQITTYYGCAKPYCDANPTAAECKGFSCTYSGSGSGQDCTLGVSCIGSPSFGLECADGTCTCTQDDVDVASVPFQEAYCSLEGDGGFMAAQQACGWTF